ncbi:MULTISPECIES: DUF397 domain-containing protein [Actinomadura]|uniref:DUF397 domain-containing protein n=1 Tax=Actinomadura yumaensis TaxID=111807 RepID=A0ABW2CXD8_9ACTN|nr:DUF397 domain-containing protein [Actinomadura sp. J1-007]MWK39146.1 DUF397 domain-containing protein [Actinomadura sp. J1-007]
MSENDFSTTRWRKSSYSGGGQTQCVEVAGLGTGVLARDSKDPDGPVLAFSAGEWRALLGVLKRDGRQTA